MIKNIFLITLALISISAKASEEAKLKVVVNDLQNVSKGDDGLLGEKISSAIKLRLSLEGRLEIIDLDTEQQRDMGQGYNYNISEHQLAENEMQYVISGNYQIIKEHISLHITIFNIINRKSYFINPKPFSSREIFASLEPITQEMVNVILANATDVNTKQVGVLCFETDKNSDKIKGKSIADEFRYSVYYNLPSAFTPILLSKADRYCSSEDLNKTSMELGADILIKASIEQSEKEMIIRPTFYISELDREILPIPYQIGIKSYYDINYNDFSNYLNKALSAIILPDGTWNANSLESDNERRYNDIIHELELRLNKDSLSDYNSITLAKQAINIRPNKPDPYYYYGRILESQNNIEGAIEYFNIAIEKNPRYADAYARTGFLQMENGRYRAASATYNLANEKVNDREIKYYTGVSYYFLDSMEQCIEWLEKVRPMPEREEEINYFLGSAYFDLGADAWLKDNNEVAEKYLNEALLYAENRYEVLTMLISTHNRQGHFNRSDTLIENGIKEGLLGLNYYLWQADELRGIYNKDKNFSKNILEEAIKYLFRYIESPAKPTAECFRLLGSCYFRMGELEKATDNYKLALELEPTIMYHHLNLAESAIMSGQYVVADEVLQKALKLPIETAEARGYEVLIHYLFYVTHVFDGENFNKDAKNIENLLNQKQRKYLNWSFTAFLRWLEHQPFEDVTKEKILSMTDRLEKGFY